MESINRALVVLAAAGLVSLSAQASPRDTKEEAHALALAAHAHAMKVGPDRAMKDISAGGSWVNKDVSAFSFDLAGRLTASAGNPKLVGKNLAEIKDLDGKQWVRDMIEVARKPPHEGWVKYHLMHPQTRKAARKESFVKLVEGTPYFVGATFDRLD